MSLVKVPSTNVTIFQDFSKIFEFDSEKYSQNTERVPKCQFGIRKNFKCRHEKLQYYNRSNKETISLAFSTGETS